MFLIVILESRLKVFGIIIKAKQLISSLSRLYSYSYSYSTADEYFATVVILAFNISNEIHTAI